MLYTSKFNVIEILLLLLFGFINTTTLIFTTVQYLGIRTAASTLLTVVFGLLFNRAIKNNNRFFKVFLYKFSRLIDILACATILGFIWTQLNLPEINLINIPSLTSNDYSYNYTFSPFGMTFPKEIFGIYTHRSFSYFIEPVYAAPFFAINGLIFKDNKNNLFAVINHIAGILTFSYLYILILFFILIMKVNVKVKFLFIFAFIFIYFLIIKYNILGSNSFMERASRAGIFFEIFNGADLFNILFGHGYGMGGYGFDKGISSGLLITILDIGLIGLAIMLAIILMLFGLNFEVIIIAVIMWLTFEVFKFPAYWVLLICMNSKFSYNINKLNK